MENIDSRDYAAKVVKSLSDSELINLYEMILTIEKITADQTASLAI